MIYGKHFAKRNQRGANHGAICSLLFSQAGKIEHFPLMITPVTNLFLIISCVLSVITWLKGWVFWLLL